MNYFVFFRKYHFSNLIMLLAYILIGCNKYKDLSNEELCETYRKLINKSISMNGRSSIEYELEKITDEINRRATIRYDSTNKEGVKYYSYVDYPICISVSLGKDKVILTKEYVDIEKLHQINHNTINGSVIYDFKRDKQNELLKTSVRAIEYIESKACIYIQNDTVKIGDYFIGILSLAESNMEYFELNINKNNEKIKIFNKTSIPAATEIFSMGINDEFHFKEHARKIGMNKFEGILKFKLKKRQQEDSIKFSYQYVVIE